MSFTPLLTIVLPPIVAWVMPRVSWRWRQLRAGRLVMIVWIISMMPPLFVFGQEIANTWNKPQPDGVYLAAVDISAATPGNKPLKISWYDPRLGGVNCDGDCSTMASGVKVTPDRYGRTAACIPEWTRARKVIVIPGAGEFECLDTGGAIKEHPDFIWIDLMVTSLPIPFGTLVDEWYIADTFAGVPTTGGKTVILPYASPVQPRLVQNGMHGENWPGRDYATPAGTPLVSPVTGTVIRKGTDSYCGPFGCYNTFVLFEADDGTQVMLMHGNYTVQVGDRVKQGQSIGSEASNGNSTEPHTHISIKQNGVFIDPVLIK